MLVFPWVIDREESLVNLEQHAALFTHVSPTGTKVLPDGSVDHSPIPRALAAARTHGLKTMPLATNGTFTPETAEAILVDPHVRERAANELATLALDHGWDGICLDFEGPWAFRSEYTDFVRRLCTKVQPKGLQVAIAVAAQTEHPAGSGAEAAWTDPYDYPALGRLVDLFIPMGYDFHGVNTLPGPVGPAWWLRAVLRHTLSCVPRQKVVLGLPLYGYRWREQDDGSWRGEYVTYAAAEKLREEVQAPLLWDYDALSRTYSFTDEEGRLNVVHYDDAQSLRRRLELVRENELAGIAFWCLGLGDPAVWPELANFLQV